MARTIRMSQHDVNREALIQAHPFQKEVVKHLLEEKGWNVQSVIPNRVGGIRVTIVSLKKDGLFVGVAPNGMIFRPRPGKRAIEWSWERMADLAQATIPAPHAVFGNLPEPVAA
jgi:hypothetical protein